MCSPKMKQDQNWNNPEKPISSQKETLNNGAAEGSSAHDHQMFYNRQTKQHLKLPEEQRTGSGLPAE